MRENKKIKRKEIDDSVPESVSAVSRKHMAM